MQEMASFATCLGEAKGKFIKGLQAELSRGEQREEG
jgi:hypothetical protein